jgi:hypothetical protein
MVCKEVGSQNTKAQLPLVHTVKQSKFSVTRNFTDTWGLIRKFTNNISFPCCPLQSIPSQPKTEAQQVFHCWKHLLTPSVQKYESAVYSCPWTVQVSWHLTPLNAYFSSAHQKSQAVLHLGSTDGAGQVLSLMDRHWCTDKTGWAVSLLWWRNKAPVHHFSGNSQIKPSCRHH